MKKRISNICRVCGKEFSGATNLRSCPSCRKKEMRYKAQRERWRRSLPYYLKTDV